MRDAPTDEITFFVGANICVCPNKTGGTHKFICGCINKMGEQPFAPTGEKTGVMNPAPTGENNIFTFFVGA